MTSNGGTQSVPQQSQSASAFSCSHCGLMFESSTSLQVHMHYQHEGQSRWGPSPTGPSSTTSNDTNETNNNQPLIKLHHIKASMSPHNQQSITAAADSSDNNPPTPQSGNEPGTPQSYQSGAQSPFAQQHSSNPPNDIHHATYPTYYEQYYHGMDYGHVPLPPSSAGHPLNNGQQHHHQQEYKTVPSSRYHHSAVPSTGSNTQLTSSNSVQITNNGMSPRVVSSTSPTGTSSSSPSQSNGQLMQIPHGQPTPSPSPKQCDKCGVVCETDGQLMEHSQVAHNSDATNGIGKHDQEQQNYPPFPPAHFNIKDEPSSDILDLDSQKMVYPHPDGALPPMHSLHPLQSMQRHPMMWGHHDPHHGFIPPHPGSDLKSSYYHQTIKTEYPPTPPIKNEYLNHKMGSVGDFSPILPPTPVSMKQDYNHIKSEYSMQSQAASGMAQSGSLPPASSIGTKNFVTDIGESGNQLTTSPSDFPSTTTPQENGQFQRTFEPPTSSLPASKGTSWKSNEARRPKTYNCTACNKWFTSSGHLKRHYNTTLHKNAVKSSGQPDPATMPISAHHHPNRDPNYVGKRRSHHQRNQQQQQANAQQQAISQSSGSQSSNAQNQLQQQQQQQQQAVPSEQSSRSPDYQPQFTLPSFGSSVLQQGFQQYGSTNLHNPPGNGQAGENELFALHYTLIKLLSQNPPWEAQKN